MNYIYVSTVIRGAAKEEASKIYKIDYATGTILNQVRLPLAMFDLANPRGGVRGARGLCFHHNKLYAAGFDGIFELRDDLFIERGWWTELNGIHQIYSIGDKIQYAATRHNKIGSFDPVTQCWAVEEDLTSVHPGVPIVDDGRGNQDTLHFNSFAGDYALFNIVGGIASISQKKTLMVDEKYLGSHDLVVLPTGEVIMNHSRQSRTVAFDPLTWQESRVLLETPLTKATEKGIATDGFFRGMSYISETDTLLVGSAPASIYCLENASRRNSNDPYRHLKITGETIESVFDVIPHSGE